MMARPEDYEAFVDATRTGKVVLAWGYGNVRAWARNRGWPAPLFGLKRALIMKMAESQQNFSDAIVDAGIDVYINEADHTVEYNAFNLDSFRFAGLEIDGMRVVARIAEMAQGLSSRSSYTLGELEVYGLLEGAVSTIRSGDLGRKVRKNRDELLKAFNAIREFKAHNGIRLEVQDPSVASDWA